MDVFTLKTSINLVKNILKNGENTLNEKIKTTFETMIKSELKEGGNMES